MGSASTYNRSKIGSLWNLIDLPVEWPGYAILLQGDLDRDAEIDPNELDAIDWIAFSEAVSDFQADVKISAIDGKLGPDTLKRLGEVHGLKRADVLRRFGDLSFRPAARPVSPPPGPPLVGNTPDERRICGLWNNYGAAVVTQASTMQIPTRTALAVFSVESGGAFDASTGLLIIRYEPHIFFRKCGETVPAERGGQRQEWQNFERAYAVDSQAALLSCSYGLPQLMGFNWKVTKHADVRSMVLAFQDSCEEQVQGFFGFVEENHLLPFIRQGDWRSFTSRYNGPGNVDVYSARLVRALKVVDALEQDGARFVA
jgi:hypothetical protein